MSAGRHRKPNGNHLNQAALLATTGAFAAVPMALTTGTASAAELTPTVEASATDLAPSINWGPIIACESGGNAHAQNSGSTASGLFQFVDGSWRAYGGAKFAARAKDATTAQQTQIANIAYQRSGLTPWTASRHCWNGKVSRTAPTTPTVRTASHTTETAHSATTHQATLHNTTGHKTTGHKTTAHKTTGHSTTRHSTTRHSTTRHSTTRHSTSHAPRHAAPNVAPGGTYTVMAGDNLARIAARHGMSWQSIRAANDSTIPRSNMLHPGEQLRLPTTADLHA